MADVLLQVNLVAADQPIWNGAAKSVIIPATGGSMGILPDHEPILALLEDGPVTIVSPDEHRHVFAVSDGFVALDSNKLTIAVEHSDEKKPVAQ